MPPEDAPAEDTRITVKWRDDSQPPTVYANHLIVSHATGPEFYLLFGELPPPALIPASAAELRNAYPEGLKINVVARIAITPEAMARFVKVMSDNLATFKKSAQEETPEKTHAGNH